MIMWINHALFWCAVILCVISVRNLYQLKKLGEFGAREWDISEKTYRILFALAVFVAVFIRIYKFGEVPGGFNQDGAMAAVDAKALAEYGTDRFGMRFPVHLTAWGIGQMSALLSYLMIPFVKAFGLVPWAVRFPSLLVSLAGLVCLYGFARDVFGKMVGLIVFCFAAVNPWHILQSRWALDCNLYPHFFLFGVFFLNRAVGKERRRRGYLFLSMVMFGLCMYCYGLSIYTMPVFLFAACVYLLVTKRVSIVDVLLSAAVYLSVAWPFIAVMAINFFRLKTIETPFFTIPYFPESLRFNDILFFSSSKLLQLKENAKSLLAVTVFQEKDFSWNDVSNFGTMYLFSMPFAVLGIGGGNLRVPQKGGGCAAFAVFRNRRLVWARDKRSQCEPYQYHLLSDYCSCWDRYLRCSPHDFAAPSAVWDSGRLCGDFSAVCAGILYGLRRGDKCSV